MGRLRVDWTRWQREFIAENPREGLETALGDTKDAKHLRQQRKALANSNLKDSLCTFSSAPVMNS